MDEASPAERPAVAELALLIEEKMTEYTEYLKMKSLKNFSMGSYLEEFPGLVHFLHIDRSAGRVIAPNIDLSVESTTKILKNKVWAMLEMSRTFLQRGHMAMMWKDVAFNYSYFLWFEDLNGTSLKPKELPNYASTNVKPTLHAGILAGEYYQ
jgi:Hermansky-Pudlak syndrome 1 protein